MADLREIGEFIEGSIDRLHRLGVIIRQSSTASLISRVRAFAAKQPDSSLENISHSLIKHLYPSAPLSLQRLLGRSILERHFNIQYRREHQRRLSTQRLAVLYKRNGQTQVHNNRLELRNYTTRMDQDDNTPNDICNDFAIQTDPMISQSSSKPSTLQTDEFYHRLEAGKQFPALSTISTTSSVPTGDISYPQPPKPLGDGNSSWATCHWCYESYPYNKFQDTGWWRRHVDHDLQPYICLIDTCPYNPAFDRFSSWLEHMENHHSLNWIAAINSKTIWRCNIEHESLILFNDEASLRDHMRKHHLDSFTEPQILRIARRSSIRIPGSQDVCPLCRYDSNNALLVADEPNDSSHNKRKRESEHIRQTQPNISDQEKRRKFIFGGKGEIIANESTSASEPASEPASSQESESVSPQHMDQLRRKELSIHIATHLKALSFVSLRLNAFQEQYEKRGHDFAM
ncbi:hypothetical protein GGI35DRAFT_362150 [Trichoderma velutinum]